MSSKSDEKLSISPKAGETSRPSATILRLVPPEERLPRGAVPTGRARQVLNKQSASRHSENNDDDPGPTAA
jgi:hypothetical protein